MSAGRGPRPEAPAAGIRPEGRPPDPAPAPAVAAHVLAAVDRLAVTLAGCAAVHDREARLSGEVVRHLGDSGLLGLRLPASGPASPHPPSTVVEAVRRLAVADPSVAQIVQNHYAALGSVLGLGFPPHVRDAVVADVRAGALLATAAAERDGADVLQVATAISAPSERGRVLQGAKYYCTGAPHARWLLAIATDPSGAKVRAIVDPRAAGVSILDDWDAIGQRATGSGSVVFDAVEVPEERTTLVGARDADSVAGALTIGLHAAIEVGVARAALEDAARFLRSGGPRPWPDARVGAASDDPLVLRRVGVLVGSVHAAEALLARAGDALDRAERSPREDAPGRVAAARLAFAEARAFASRVALQVSSELFAVGGTSSARGGHAHDRHWRNSRTHSLQVPVDWVDHYVGDAFVNGAGAPPHGRI